MGNLTAKVMATAEIDDRKIGPIQPWFFFFFSHRKGPAEVFLPSLSSVSLYRLISPTSQGDAVAVAAPVWLNALAAASVPFIPISPAQSFPTAFSTRCFWLFGVCSPSPWLVLLWIGVLRSCFFCLFVCFELVLSASGAISPAQSEADARPVRHRPV